jgi:hypothetical protein
VDQFAQVVLEKTKFCVLKRLSLDFAIAARMDVDEQAQFHCDDICIRVTQGIMGEKLQVVEASAPADWWQAFRERWMPKWWLDRWPVKRNWWRLSARALYPRISLPDAQHYVHLAKLGPMQYRPEDD